MALLNAKGFFEGESANLWSSSDIYGTADFVINGTGVDSPRMFYRSGRYPDTKVLSFSSGRIGVTGWAEGNLNYNITNAPTTICFGFSHYSTAFPSNGSNLLYIVKNTAGSSLMSFCFYGSGGLGRLRVIDQVTTDTDTYLLPNTHYYVEVKYTPNQTSGYLEIRINGSTVFTKSGDVVAGSAVAIPGSITLGSANSRETTPLNWVAIGDVYILDSSGTDNNDFLGDVVVNRILPNANGSITELIGSDGNQIDNYALVRDAPASLSRYVESNVSGSKDLYGFSTIDADDGAVLAVIPRMAASKDGANFGTIRSVIKKDSSYLLGPKRNLASGSVQALPSVIYERDPDNLYWTPSTINDSEFGVEVGDV